MSNWYKFCTRYWTTVTLSLTHGWPLQPNTHKKVLKVSRKQDLQPRCCGQQFHMHILFNIHKSQGALIKCQGKIRKPIPLPANNNLLTAGKLEFCSAEGFLGMLAVAVLTAHRKEDLTNAYSCTYPLWLAKSTPHPSLEPISPSTWEHLVDPQNMEWVHPHSQMECILTSKFGHVLVAGNSSCFQCLTCNIFLFPAHKMDTKRKLINTFLLHSNIIYSDLGIGDTTTISWFRVGFVFDLTITPCRSYKSVGMHSSKIRTAACNKLQQATTSKMWNSKIAQIKYAHYPTINIKDKIELYIN